ncbi:putative enzyme related to lactoylglutathione lyase [Nonomuraea muscovyensis]|uniref:Putative enzyme related to lactoylglutathione lyase n=1 Tax=Nonomuraea muscovyensis TaxID=1124761 RepID=A0A7X0BV82_9ACTN|nr:VOC family protein [Nonomuraea muscovyensis]MBB6343527.1 putative enzyme related to lactoylglutathione lyase [Nonomuraea muscovyensis]
MHISSISTVTLPVADQQRALDFHAGVLGLEVRSDNPSPMGRWLSVAPKGAETALLLASWFPDMAPVGGLVAASPDLDALAERLREHGTQVQGPTNEAWGRQLLFNDPDGNGFVVTQA